MDKLEKHCNLPPHMLSHNTKKLTPELCRIDVVAVDDIARLWKVFSTTQSAMNSGTCRRLENLFWRIWGSHRPILSRNECHNAVSKLHGRSLRVQGQTLAELFWRIDASRLDEQLVVKKIKKTTTAPVVSRSVESAIILDDEEKSAISQNTGIDLPAQILHHAVCLPKRKKRVSFQDRCDTVYIQD